LKLHITRSRDEITLACAASPIHPRKNRRRDARFHAPKIHFGNELQACFGFPGILGPRPGNSRADPAAVIQTNADESIAVAQFVTA
jgi:hypothetical protein